MFVRDRYLGTTELVSRTGAGIPASGSTQSEQMLADRSVIVTSSAPELGGVSGGNGTLDAFELTFSAPGFNALAKPVRLLDTRSGKKGLVESLGGSLATDVTVALPANTVKRYVVTGANTGIPANVAALAMNVTVLAPAAAGSLKLYACATAATTAPAPATMLFPASANTSHGGVVRPALGGGICLRSTVATHVTLDASGFFTTESGMTGLPKSVRLLDTRAGQKGALELAGAAIGTDVTVPLAANTPVRVQVTGVAGVPASVDAVSVNLTALAPAAAATIKVYACSTTGAIRPTAWALLVPAGVSLSDAQVTKVAANGGLCLLSTVQTHVTLDVNAYVASGTGFAGLARPTVLLDTRSGKKGALESATDVTTPYAAGTVKRYVLSGVAGLPANASGVVLQTSVITPAASGTLRVYPCTSTASPKPTSSVLEFSAGTSAAHSEVVGLSSTGGVCVYSSASTHVTLSVVGSFDA